MHFFSEKGPILKKSKSLRCKLKWFSGYITNMWFPPSTGPQLWASSSFVHQWQTWLHILCGIVYKKLFQAYRILIHIMGIFRNRNLMDSVFSRGEEYSSPEKFKQPFFGFVIGATWMSKSWWLAAIFDTPGKLGHDLMDERDPWRAPRFLCCRGRSYWKLVRHQTD